VRFFPALISFLVLPGTVAGLIPAWIVSTDRGFSLYRGLGPDGYTNDFLRVPNPLSSRQP